MSIQHAAAGEIIELPLGAGLNDSKTTTLAKLAGLELIRLVIPAGKDIPVHKAPGVITVQCLEGRVAFSVGERTQELTTGQLLYLDADEPHALRGIEDSSLLVTLLLPQNRIKPSKLDMVQEASEESFPASDPPSNTGITRP